MSPRPLVIELFRDRGRVRRWRFRAVAGNGEIVAASQGYATKWNAKRAALHIWPDAKVEQVPVPKQP